MFHIISDKYPPQSTLRKNKVQTLQAALCAQQNTFFTAENKSKANTETSLKITYILASHKKPYSDGVGHG